MFQTAFPSNLGRGVAHILKEFIQRLRIYRSGNFFSYFHTVSSGKIMNLPKSQLAIFIILVQAVQVAGRSQKILIWCVQRLKLLQF